MKLQHRLKILGLATLAVACVTTKEVAAQVPAGFITSFEASGPTEVTYPLGYTTGSLQFQDNWTGTRMPRVQTGVEISAELAAAGLNPANSVRTGDQALLVAKLDAAVEGTGYLVHNAVFGLESTKKVIVDFWARPLTSGLGADPAGTPAGNDKTIGERQGNTFVGISSDTSAGGRAAAVRFGIDVEPGNPNPYTNAAKRRIDFASATAGSAVWIDSGLTWEADQWYNFKFDLDYDTKRYDFYVNGLKVNPEPIVFYNEGSTAANQFFVSRGTNQAGQIIDDISVTEKIIPPFTPGDFNLDGKVDGNDFLVWQRDTTVGSLVDWKNNFGTGASGLPAVGAIPEPSSLILTAFGLLFAARYRRRNAIGV